MKKSTLLAFGMALLAGTAVAQNAQEVTYVEDPAQGYLFNRFKNNWFIQAEGGVGFGISHEDKARKWSDRFAPAAHLYVGKWFSPILGSRVGVDFMSDKGSSKVFNLPGCQPWQPLDGGKYCKTKENLFGLSLDVMLNLTNWWCGYKPNRVYEAYVYAGGGGAFVYTKQPDGKEYKWKDAKDRTTFLRFGLTQNFNLSKRFALGLDLRASAIAETPDAYDRTHMYYAEALLTATVKLGKTTWNAPIVPVCPPAENCDEYRARLQAADARIADLEAQLKACLSRPTVAAVAEAPAKAPLATIYYPCNVYRLTSVDRKVLESVANVMKADTSVKYTLTGWADNYTGTDAINVRLRENRVNGVKTQLVKYGVSADQLNATINNGNRVDLGEKCLTLDRCVTIEAE